MKYILKPHVTAVMLAKIGFTDNRLDRNGKTYPIEVTRNGFECSRNHKDENICVAIYKDKYIPDGAVIEVYAYEGIATDHRRLYNIEDQTPYLEDLIELGYVEVIK